MNYIISSPWPSSDWSCEIAAQGTRAVVIGIAASIPTFTLATASANLEQVNHRHLRFSCARSRFAQLSWARWKMPRSVRLLIWRRLGALGENACGAHLQQHRQRCMKLAAFTDLELVLDEVCKRGFPFEFFSHVTKHAKIAATSFCTKLYLA